MEIFESIESNVRSYIRHFPVIFDKAKGSKIYDEYGNAFIDFFAGAGSLNYGHNNPIVNKALIKYLKSDGITLSLDKATVAKREFLKRFNEIILLPRNLDYKIQFTGPTGANSVEAALKLARLIKKRQNIISFTNAYHGLSLGALAITGNSFYHNQFYSHRSNVAHMPYDGYFGEGFNTLSYMRRFLEDKGSGIELPAAIIVEIIQCEGGVNIASISWLKELELLCKELDILLIVDDIQIGNGRTGRFFSFEEAGLYPDLVCISKSIGGGHPMALLLIKPELDQWQPGKHTGTFRGNNLAMVASTEILNSYWQTNSLIESIDKNSKIIRTYLDLISQEIPELNMKVKGRGMIWGLEIPKLGFPNKVISHAFKRKLIIETCGINNHTIKLIPPLIIKRELLKEGLDIFRDVIHGLSKDEG
ncbi:diaminobutyrate--2-oxoglutarate transaminase [Spirosoma sp. SC4-14]|uniref:diaminobutyrate--2-oxoglutarate transaminase n=1 Tax=Spirosoma sp. SC4-14 TaxID=3128900 RepID=UPI0030D4E993